MAVFLYDGDCAFCTSSARWLERRAPSATRILPWQFAELGELGLTPEDCETAVQHVAGGRRTAGPDAIAAYLVTSTPGWRLAGRLLATTPVRLVGWPAYRWVARNRHRLPGGTPACAVPRHPQG